MNFIQQRPQGALYGNVETEKKGCKCGIDGRLMWTPEELQTLSKHDFFYLTKTSMTVSHSCSARFKALAADCCQVHCVGHILNMLYEKFLKHSGVTGF